MERGFDRKRERSPPPFHGPPRYRGEYPPRGPEMYKRGRRDSDEFDTAYGRGRYRRPMPPRPGFGRGPPPPWLDDDTERDRVRFRGGPQRGRRRGGGRGPPRGMDRPDRGGGGLMDGAMKSYKEFLQFQDDNVTPQEAEKLYTQYKADYKKKQDQLFFDRYKKQEWFRRLYDPSFLAASQAAKKDYALAASTKCLAALRAGTLEMQSAEKPVTEQETEVYVRMQDEPRTEGDKEGEAASASAPAAGESESAGEADLRKYLSLRPRVRAPADAHVLSIKRVPASVSHEELQNVFKETSGVVRIVASDVHRCQGDLCRQGWIVYATADECHKALQQLNGRKLKDWEVLLTPHRPEDGKPANVTPECASTPRRLAVDLVQAADLIRDLDAHRGLPSLLGDLLNTQTRPPTPTPTPTSTHPYTPTHPHRSDQRSS
eukprot:gnl/Trimastix_PCT/3367.p1 GENE.gnl/Trimastix_PCT/3367~~gnl/Trimastix_PCT/3367.p1  ORF type:complete len:454 (-),score=125.49 gnl/Trimastix_PCT/3367:893-2185(-)